MAKKFKSKFEGEFWKHRPKRQGLTVEYEPDTIEYIIKSKYTPDWIVRLKSGRVFYIETKGKLKYEDRRKLLAIKNQHPNIDLRILFQKASNKLRKGSKTTYGEWAEKNGFLWSEGFSIPKEWLKE